MLFTHFIEIFSDFIFFKLYLKQYTIPFVTEKKKSNIQILYSFVLLEFYR